MNKPTFCPKCHRPINLPFDTSKMKIEGELKIACGNCKHVVIIKPSNTKD